MLACFAFLLMAVEVYNVPLSSLINNLLSMLIGLGLIVVISAAVGWLLVILRKRRK
jgi:hypothetical protein|tara:strand:+ start:295 stop:462 length:168 start_codon:yes stop_codon:yes gene_type:complete